MIYVEMSIIMNTDGLNVCSLVVQIEGDDLLVTLLQIVFHQYVLRNNLNRNIKLRYHSAFFIILFYF